MSNLFSEIIPSILQTKQNCIVDDLTEKTYPPFMVNKALSYHVDCILYANQMNMMPQLPNKMQYDYLFNSVRSSKRSFNKWAKPIKEADLESVKLYFGYSTKQAREILQCDVLSKDQLKFIREQTRID